MRIREEHQLNIAGDEVLALTAVVRPILTGILYALKADVVSEVGGYENVKLKLLPRLYRAGDGDCGICFEYAVHEAMNRGDGRVLERIRDATELCNLPGLHLKSILFGLEKSGAQCVIAVGRRAHQRHQARANLPPPDHCLPDTVMVCRPARMPCRVTYPLDC
jgi:hypothetical protein